jgi:hypothetical protein
VDNWKKVTNSRIEVRKKSFGGTFCFSNCHIIAKIPPNPIFGTISLDSHRLPGSSGAGKD